MKNILALFVFLLCVGAAFAQGINPASTVSAMPVSTSGMPIPAAQAATPASTPVVPSCSLVNIGVSYIHFGNGMSGTMEEAAHPFTNCAVHKYILSLGFAMIQIPGANTSFYLIGPRLDFPLVKYFPKIDPLISSLTPFVGGGFGTAQVAPSNIPQSNHFAYGFHGGVTASPGSLFGVNTTVSIEGGLVGYGGHTFRANTLPDLSGQVSAAVMFNLGKQAPAPTASAAKQ
jgi:hypothetical protein